MLKMRVGQSSRGNQSVKALIRTTWLGQQDFYSVGIRSNPYTAERRSRALEKAVWVVGSNPAWPTPIYRYKIGFLKSSFRSEFKGGRIPRTEKIHTIKLQGFENQVLSSKPSSDGK